MIDIPSKTTVPGQDSIASLREGLSNVTRIIARHRGADALLAELSQHVGALQDLLSHLEQELTAHASERGELTQDMLDKTENEYSQYKQAFRLYADLLKKPMK